MARLFGATSYKARRRPFQRPSSVISDVKKHPRQIEAGVTQRVVNYVRREYPQAIIITDAIGLDLTDKQRQQLMALRSEKGQPDVSIDYPSRGYHGLRIELKKEGEVIFKKDGTLRKNSYTREYFKGRKRFVYRGDHNQEQYATLKKYEALGYCGRYAIGFDAAQRLIDWYFERPEQSELF